MIGYIWNYLFNRKKKVEVRPILTRNFHQGKVKEPEEVKEEKPLVPSLKPPETKIEREREIEPPERIVGIKVSRDLKHLHPKLRKAYLELEQTYEMFFPGRQMIPTCTYRSPIAQQELFKVGRFGDTRATITECDGRENMSRHNNYPAEAVDVAILEGGKAIWDLKYYYPLKKMCKRLKLTWGGTFPKTDACHIELPKGGKNA